MTDISQYGHDDLIRLEEVTEGKDPDRHHKIVRKAAGVAICLLPIAVLALIIWGPK